MAQQTAVEWLEQSIKNKITAPIYERLVREGHFEQAKQMEKEQIKDAWHNGNFLGRNGNILADYSDCDGYYKSEYQGNKSNQESENL